MQHPPFLSLTTFRTAALALAVATAARAGVVELEQSLSVKYGWNALFVEVSPTNDLDEVFEDWPTDSVGIYDPASFLATRQQHVASSESQGMSIAPIAMWHRDQPAATDALMLPANSACIFFSSNSETITLKVHGVPAAPRTTWHATDSHSPYNFFGISLQNGAVSRPGDVLDGFSGISSLSGIYRLFGTDSNSIPSMTRLYSTSKLYDGNVILVPSSKISDWSGVLYVSPMDGLDYATNATVRSLSIRNDSTQERNTSIDLVPMDGSRDLVGSLYFRDSDVAITNSVWQKVETTHVATKVLATGETWRVEFGLDRSIFDQDLRGTPFGAALRITDDGGTSKWRVDVPLQGEASGMSAERNAWPGGLWVAEIEFDEIYFAGDPDAGYTGTGGTLKARLPVHFGSDGKIRLLQRVVAAGETSADGEFDYTLYAGSATVPSTYRQAMRISSAVLPTETPVVEASEDESESGRLVFDFAVAADGATSLLRHPLHPQHDGLRWDFSTPAPDGDDWENYRDTVKPETFSVVNRIIMQIELSGGETTWNPEDTKSGTCYWNLSGLRHEGAIVLRGPMVFKRVAPQSEIVLE